MPIASILWRRVDAPGHDACRLAQTEEGWELDGATTFLHEGVPASLAYQVRSDRLWCTRDGAVRGWVGAETFDLSVRRTNAGLWSINDDLASHLDGCVDLDLGFTPATNLFQLRRIDLAEGQALDLTVAWLDAASRKLEVLQQRYERRTASTYWYEAPRFGYAGLLEIQPAGFVTRYPGLWEEVV